MHWINRFSLIHQFHHSVVPTPLCCSYYSIYHLHLFIVYWFKVWWIDLTKCFHFLDSCLLVPSSRKRSHSLGKFHLTSTVLNFQLQFHHYLEGDFPSCVCVHSKVAVQDGWIETSGQTCLTAEYRNSLAASSS